MKTLEPSRYRPRRIVTLGRAIVLAALVAALACTARPERGPDTNEVRALVVDDNAVNRKVLCEQLRRWGMREDACESPQEALAQLCLAFSERDPYRIALIDQQMPGIDGITLGRMIRTHPDLADLPLVILTRSFSGRELWYSAFGDYWKAHFCCRKYSKQDITNR